MERIRMEKEKDKKKQLLQQVEEQRRVAEAN